MKVIHFGLQEARPIGDDGSIFRLVVLSNTEMHIEARCFDKLGAVSWRPAKIDNNRYIPRLLATALLKLVAQDDVDIGTVRP